jgi:hypothetical protein
MRLTIAVILTTLGFSPALAAATLDDRIDATILPLERPIEIGGVRLACTAIAETRTEPQWQGYSVRIGISNTRPEDLAGEEVTVRDVRGRILFTVGCDDPWVLADLAPGTYLVEARLHGAPDAEPRTANVRAPARGQVRVVLQFSN